MPHRCAMLLDLMTTLSLRRGWPIVAVVGLGACGGDNGGRPRAEALQALIATHCERVDTCECGGTLMADTCSDVLSDRWNERVREGERRDLQYDGACFASLSAQVEILRCEAPSVQEGLCQSFCAIFHGGRALGESCESYDALVSDCAQGLVCSQNMCTEPCAALDGRVLGERCSAPMDSSAYDDCAKDLFCDTESGFCAALVGEGESCQEVRCIDGFDCVETAEFEFRCVAEPMEEEQSPCDALHCGPQAFCDQVGDDVVCTLYAKEGESCFERSCDERLTCINETCRGPAEEGEICFAGRVCAEDYRCDPTLDVCVPLDALPDEGEVCASGQCIEGTQCLSTADDPEGTCIALYANDEMCSGHSQCASDYCPNGFCWTVPGLDDDCGSDGRCARGLVCNGELCEPTLTRAPAACSYPGW